MDSQDSMASHELYHTLYNSNQTVHNTPIIITNSSKMSVPLSHNSSSNADDDM